MIVDPPFLFNIPTPTFLYMLSGVLTATNSYVWSYDHMIGIRSHFGSSELRHRAR